MEGGEAGQGEEESLAQPVQTAREIKRRLVVNNERERERNCLWSDVRFY